MFESVKIARLSRPSCVVVGHFAGEQPSKATLALDGSGALAAAAKRADATGELGRIVEAFPEAAKKSSVTRVILVGLGKKDAFNVGDLRAAAAAVGRRLAVTKDEQVDVELAPALMGAAKKVDLAAAGSAFGEGLGLVGYPFDHFRGTGNGGAPKRGKLMVNSGDHAFASGMARGLALAESANFARGLSHTPPNICTPAFVAAQAQKMAKQAGLKCTVWKGEALEKERFEGLINVGKASENLPCMIRLEYKPKGGGSARNSKPVVLIGKTMTYDSGGLSLKINNGMRGMKRDKDGGCAVIGAMHAIATVIQPRRPVVALLAVAENSISDEAYRPDDVLTYRNGVTVEVTNTDAEGRLVLADALCWACEKEDPAYIVDLATLTGGVVTALGSTYAGMFCEDDALRGKVEAAAGISGERVWRLPMHQEYRDMMKSNVADILNSNPNRKAHPIQGAAFLSYFVTPGTAWCHLDIAGVHAVEGDSGPFVKESATGWGVRLLAEMMEAE
jgi:leucyl aminopeptidase